MRETGGGGVGVIMRGGGTKQKVGLEPQYVLIRQVNSRVMTNTNTIN